jgi:hypothetical protein
MHFLLFMLLIQQVKGKSKSGIAVKKYELGSVFILSKKQAIWEIKRQLLSSPITGAQ